MGAGMLEGISSRCVELHSCMQRCRKSTYEYQTTYACRATVLASGPNDVPGVAQYAV